MFKNSQQKNLARERDVSQAYNAGLFRSYGVMVFSIRGHKLRSYELRWY